MPAETRPRNVGSGATGSASTWAESPSRSGSVASVRVRDTVRGWGWGGKVGSGVVGSQLTLTSRESAYTPPASSAPFEADASIVVFKASPPGCGGLARFRRTR